MNAWVDETRQDVYQLFELVPHSSHELGVFRFILSLQGHYRLNGTGTGIMMSALDVGSHVSFDF